MERWRDDEGRFDPLKVVRDLVILVLFLGVLGGAMIVYFLYSIGEFSRFPMEVADFRAQVRSIQPGMTEAEADALIQGYTSKRVGENSTRYIMARGEDLENPSYHNRHFIIVRYDENRKVMSAQYAD